MSKKLFFFGIDSATWDLIIPWVKQGKLPGFAKLINNGTVADLYSTIPPLTPVAWPTIMTGASPAQHGQYDFYYLDKAKELNINLASDIPYPFVWELLSQANKTVAVVNIPITFPPRPVKGIQISGILTPSLKADFVFPPELKKEFVSKFPHYSFTPKSKVTRHDSESYNVRFKETKQEVYDVIKVTEWVLSKHEWDFMAMNFMAVDHIQHFYWEFMEQKNSKHKNAILEIYQLVDQYLLKLIKKYNKKYQFMITSDHGAGKLEKTMFLNVWLARKGYLKFKHNPLVWFKRLIAGFGITPQQLINLASYIKLSRYAGEINMQKRNRLMNKLVLSYSDLDWQKTIAYSFGMYAGIFINKNAELQLSPLRPWLISRDSAGQAKFNYQKIQNKIIKEMKRDFKQELTFIESSEHIYKTKKYPSTIPDIQFFMKEGAIVSTNIYAFSGNKLFTAPITHKSSDHRVKGILGFYPKLKLKKLNRQYKLVDITPTILDFFNLPIPIYCKGQSLFRPKQQPENNIFKKINV